MTAVTDLSGSTAEADAVEQVKRIGQCEIFISEIWAERTQNLGNFESAKFGVRVGIDRAGDLREAQRLLISALEHGLKEAAIVRFDSDSGAEAKEPALDADIALPDGWSETRNPAVISRPVSEGREFLNVETGAKWVRA